MSIANDPEVWAAIHEESGLVCGLCDMEYYTFAQAVRDFKPREVRRMERDKAIDQLLEFEKWKKARRESSKKENNDLFGEANA